MKESTALDCVKLFSSDLDRRMEHRAPAPFSYPGPKEQRRPGWREEPLLGTQVYDTTT